MNSRTMSLLLVLGSVLALTLLLGVAAGAQEAAPNMGSATTAAQRPLIYALSGEPNLAVHEATDDASLLVLGQLMEAPYRHAPDGSLEPAGALTHTASADATVFTVTLRADGRWSDGQPVTAQHYVDGILRLLDPATASGYAWLMWDIQNGQAYNQGTITDPDLVGVKAAGPQTLVFTMGHSAGHFPTLLALFIAYPVRLDLIAGDPAWTEADHFVGNGPYVLAEWDHDSYLLLEKNPLYYGAANVSIEQIRFPVIGSQAQQLAAYEDGIVDVADFPDSEAERILADQQLAQQVQAIPRPGTYYLGFNTQRPPTDNVLVRKALASAIDRKEIVTDVLHAPWRSTFPGVVSPGMPSYQGDGVGYTFDVTQAQTFLTQAGYPGGAGFPGIELWANEGHELTIEAVAQQWRDNLGITVTTVYSDWSSDYLPSLGDCRADPGACSYNAYRNGWVNDYADAMDVLDVVFRPDSTMQYTGWDNARYRELMDLIPAETDPVSRTQDLQEAERILVEDEAVATTIYGYDIKALVKPYVTHIEYVPFHVPYLMDWQLTTVATTTIPTAGGTIATPDGLTTVEFPAGAVTETVLVTCTMAYSPSDPPPGSFAFAGRVFKVEAVSAQNGQAVIEFNPPLRITIDYRDGALNGTDDSTLSLRFWTGSEWVSDGITVVQHDTATNRLVVTVDHLTEFALFGRYKVYLPAILCSR